MVPKLDVQSGSQSGNLSFTASIAFSTEVNGDITRGDVI